MTLDDLLSRLDGVRQRGAKWSGRCPAHDDRTPSLSISEGDKGVLLKCWAGCTTQEICTTLGIGQADLFYDSGLPRNSRPAPKPPRLDRRALAFQFEMGALDRRLRAQNILNAAKGIEVGVLGEIELDRAISHVAQIYLDEEHADVLPTPREPLCSMNQTRSASSRHTSMK